MQGETLDGPWDHPIWLGFVQGGRGGRKVAQTRDLVHFPLYFILRLVNVGCGGWGEYLTCERWTWACMIWHEGVIDDVTKSLLLKLTNVSNTWGCCAWSWLRESWLTGGCSGEGVFGPADQRGGENVILVAETFLIAECWHSMWTSPNGKCEKVIRHWSQPFLTIASLPVYWNHSLILAQVHKGKHGRSCQITAFILWSLSPHLVFAF